MKVPPPTPGTSHISELAPMALCDIHVAGCGEHLPAWGLRDDCIPGTDQAVRGGRHGQKLHSGFPPRQVDARSSADARSNADACLSLAEGRRRLTEPTTKALCQPPPRPDHILVMSPTGLRVQDPNIACQGTQGCSVEKA